MEKNLSRVLEYLKKTRGVDFSGYRPGMLERRTGTRLAATGCGSFEQYLGFLKEHKDEPDRLVDALTINVTAFFRDPLCFEYIAEKILPGLVLKKAGEKNHSLRVWDAGCASGEEVYSAAILVHKTLKKEKLELDLVIIATDIDQGALDMAKQAVYTYDSIKNVKYEILKKYFTAQGDKFRLSEEIKNLVTFSRYDMLDEKTVVPPESVFGEFDLVFCRNLLIYFNTEHHDLIFYKLYRSLAKNGLLVLGKSEIPPPGYQGCFKRVTEAAHIYRKLETGRIKK